MKTDNLFKFVSVRPPKPSGEDKLFFPEGPGYTFEAPPDSWSPTHGNNAPSPPMARRVAGAAIINSGDYFQNDASWKKLRPQRQRAREIIARQSPEPDMAIFQQEAGQLFAETLGSTSVLPRLLKAPRFKAIKQTLWVSYYALVLAPELRRQDLEELLGWICFFHLMELSVDDPDGFKKVALHPRRVRPAVPIYFYKPKEAQPIEVEAPPRRVDPVAKDKAAISGEMALIKDAKGFIEKAYNQKLRKFRNMRFKPSSRPGAGDAAKGEGVSGADLLAHAPWRLDEKDFRDNRKHLDALVNMGLDPITVTVPDLMQAMEERAASCEAKLRRLDTTRQVVGAGKALVKIMRPVRVPGRGE